MANLIRRKGQVWPLYDLQNQINQLFGEDYWGSQNEVSSMTDWIPPMDIKEEKNQFIFRFDIPGVDQKDMSVNYENGKLIVKGEKETKTEEKSEDYRRVERTRGSFLRQISAPDIDPNKIKAKYQNGVLEVTAPKLHAATSKDIKIQS